jgi:hypothetical protein
MTGKQKKSLIFSTNIIELSILPQGNVRFEVLIAVTMKITVFCDAVKFGRYVQVFQRNLLPPSSGHMMGVK